MLAVAALDKDGSALGVRSFPGDCSGRFVLEPLQPPAISCSPVRELPALPLPLRAVRNLVVPAPAAGVPVAETSRPLRPMGVDAGEVIVSSRPLAGLKNPLALSRVGVYEALGVRMPVADPIVGDVTDCARIADMVFWTKSPRDMRFGTSATCRSVLRRSMA